MGHQLQRYIQRSAPGGWLSIVVGASWEALKYHDKVGDFLPLPAWSLFGVGVLWVILAKRARELPPPIPRPMSSEVLVVRERTTTVEREFVLRREG